MRLTPVIYLSSMAVSHAAGPARVFIGIKFCPDGSLAAKIAMIKRAVASLGLTPYVLEEDMKTPLPPHELMAKDFREIDASDLVILDVTDPSFGVGIEAQYARRTKRVIAIASAGATVSDSIKGICAAFIQYSDQSDLAEKLKPYLAAKPRGISSGLQ